MVEIRRCRNCQKEFHFKTSQLKKYKGGGQFCCRDCHYLFYRNHHEDHPLFKPIKSDAVGYRLVRVPGKTVAVREHRHIMEKILGRKLREDEHIHHINGQKEDNRIENLVVLKKIEHHRQHGNDIRSIEGAKKGRSISHANYIEWKKTHWAHGHDSCVECKSTKLKHQGHGMCSHCYLNKYRKRIYDKNKNVYVG